MISALVNRLLLSIPVLIGVVIFGFLLIKMAPGDPAQIMAGPTATPGARTSAPPAGTARRPAARRRTAT